MHNRLNLIIAISLMLAACATTSKDPWRDDWLANAKKPVDTGSHVWWERTKAGW